MITETELIASIGPLRADTLRRWIDRGWVLPHQDDETLRFDPADVVRVRLIYELRYALRIEEDSLPVVLSLLDQLYAARRHLRMLSEAVKAQPQDVRTNIDTHVTASHLKPAAAP